MKRLTLSSGLAVLVDQEFEDYDKIGFINIEFLSKPTKYLAELHERF